jgi:hypothetical protein
MSQQKSQKSNWLIQAEYVTNTEEKAFLSMFGYVKKGTKMNKPSKENDILYAIVDDGSGTSFALRKHMMVCNKSFAQYVLLLQTIILILTFTYSTFLGFCSIS